MKKASTIRGKSFAAKVNPNVFINEFHVFVCSLCSSIQNDLTILEMECTWYFSLLVFYPLQLLTNGNPLLYFISSSFSNIKLLHVFNLIEYFQETCSHINTLHIQTAFTLAFRCPRFFSSAALCIVAREFPCLIVYLYVLRAQLRYLKRWRKTLTEQVNVHTLLHK